MGIGALKPIAAMSWLIPMLFVQCTFSHAQTAEAPRPAELASNFEQSAVRGVTVTQNAIAAEAGTAGEDCQKFRRSPPMVKAHFRRARAIDNFHDYQWGACSATGTVEFANGVTGRWQILSSRLGFLYLPDGRWFNFFCRDLACRDSVYAFYAGANSDSEDSAAEDRAGRRADAEHKPGVKGATPER